MDYRPTLPPSLAKLFASLRHTFELRVAGERMSYSKYVSIWFKYLWLGARVAITKRSLQAQCPACGHRKKHEMRWASALKDGKNRPGALVHKCAVCGAAWGERPIVDPKHWQIDMSADQFDELSPPNHEQAAPLEIVA